MVPNYFCFYFIIYHPNRQACVPPRARLRRHVNLNFLHNAPFFQNGLQAKSGFEMCFDIGSRHLGCWGQHTSRIQNKGVYATLCLQARVPLRSKSLMSPGTSRSRRACGARAKGSSPCRWYSTLHLRDRSVGKPHSFLLSQVSVPTCVPPYKYRKLFPTLFN